MTLALLGLFTDLNDRFSHPFYILYLLKSLRFTDTSILRTAFLVPGKRKPLHFL